MTDDILKIKNALKICNPQREMEQIASDEGNDDHENDSMQCCCRTSQAPSRLLLAKTLVKFFTFHVFTK